ncbi:kinase-like domain-containing protein [Rhizophagus irregularis DAOM 181602=DAOM 197198]|uniref:Protein kinase domain-containing protein n=1 Tax=Rhizophagus irregularis (strain DAOM 197198w) TaxID=1432141 RepID=A0A015LLW2_RHIIW|nr:hypothetical protein RirG_222150 [Rhizophagus irregularis DAOM 197198w]GET60645.1 kinase-like domain-containing protein [Rhizophagus irregularis DAOM 181602=DAOM 197198]
MSSQNKEIEYSRNSKYLKDIFTNWISGNERIDAFIQKMQLKIDDSDNTVLEWIPHNQFGQIKEIDKNDLITVYSAIWEVGPLCKENIQNESYYTRDSNKEVALICLHNLQTPIEFVINEVKKYSTGIFGKDIIKIYGISQNPITNNYILAQKHITWINGNEKIDDFIQERQLNIGFYNDVVFEWIPYNQFNEIKETGKNGSITVYSAIWKNGPLYYSRYTEDIRDSNKEVALKCLYNLQNPVDFLINEAKNYSTIIGRSLALYGISQNPDTSNYILVFTWTSGNEKIDDFIQKRQLNINSYNDVVFEWIPYNQFNEIKETGKNSSITVYSAIWKNGSLHKEDRRSNYYTRDSYKEVALKCLHNLQNSIDSLINEVKEFYKYYYII